MANGASGLASGIDTGSIIEQLLAVERRPRIKLQLRERQVEARENAFRDISTRLRNLKMAAADLRSLATWGDTQTVSSSDETKATARRTSNAGPGGYSIDITALARAEQRTFTFTADATNPFDLTIDGVPVNLAAGETLDGAVAKINATAGITVYATNVNNKLVLSHKETGDVRITSSATGTASLAEDTTKEILGQDAAYKINGGTTQYSAKNVVAGAIAGIELTLKGITPAGAPMTINVGPAGADREAVKNKLKTFVDQYNSTVEFINSKVKEKKVVNPQTDADYLKGVLSGDTMSRGVLAQLRQALSDVVGDATDTLNDNYDSLAEIGISTGGAVGASTLNQDAIAGKLSFDEAKFNAAMDANNGAVKQMLGAVANFDGMAQRFERIIDPYTQTAGTIDTRISGTGSEKTRIRSQIDAIDRRLERKELLLKAQFQAMESAMAKSQSAGNYLAR